MWDLLAPFFNSPLTALGSLFALGAAFGVVVFLWGLITHLFSTGNARERTLGNTYLMWGVSLVFLFFALWEIVGWIARAISQG